MAVTLTGTGGLFTRVGTIGALIRHLNGAMGNTAPNTSATWGSNGPDIVALGTAINNIQAQYTSSRQDLIDGLYAQRDSFRSADSGLKSYLQQLAQTTVIEMVDDDTYLPNKTLSAALGELIDQMEANSASVEAPTVSVSSTAGGSNNGDGVCRASVVGPDGVQMDYVFAESIRVTCTADSQQGSTEGQETFAAVGDGAVSDPLAYNWPGGSGASATLTAVDSSVDAGANLLTNGDLEDWTGNVPDNWSSTLGTTPGTDLVKNTSVLYAGSASLEFTENSGSTPGITQTFGLAAGTVGRLQPGTVYALNFWACRSAGLSGDGVIQVDLVDDTGTVIDDDAGTDNTITVTAASLGESFSPCGGFFRTPSVMPDSYKIRVWMSEAMDDAGASVYLTRFALTPATQLYAGGPYAAVFSGATKFIVGDRFTLTVSNDYGSDWQLMAERLFGMRELGLQLPSSSTPTIADTLL